MIERRRAVKVRKSNCHKTFFGVPIAIGRVEGVGRMYRCVRVFSQA